MQKLNFTQSVRDSRSIYGRNVTAILAALLLWLSTLWIPGINIGTTIALLLLPARLAEGTRIHPFEIFRAEYRSRMSDCFLMAGMMAVPIVLALTFVFFPGVVLLLAWSQAFSYLILRNKEPIEAIRASNRATCGSKWTMLFVLVVILGIPTLIGTLCLFLCEDAFGLEVVGILAFILYLVITTLEIATLASFWRQLGNNVK